MMRGTRFCQKPTERATFTIPAESRQKEGGEVCAVSEVVSA